jgi:hypothetical protein
MPPPSSNYGRVDSEIKAMNRQGAKNAKEIPGGALPSLARQQQ